MPASPAFRLHASRRLRIQRYKNRGRHPIFVKAKFRPPDSEDTQMRRLRCRGGSPARPNGRLWRGRVGDPPLQRHKNKNISVDTGIENREYFLQNVLRRLSDALRFPEAEVY